MPSNNRVVRGGERRGLAFPLNKGTEGYWSRKNAQALRKTSIMMILGTHRGERVGLPEFGSRLRELLFDPNDALLTQNIKEEVIESLSRWDPYIHVVGVATETVDNSVSVYIDYIDLADENQRVRRVDLAFPRS